MKTGPRDIPVDALREVARRPEIVAAMRAFYTDADRRIAGQNATCWNRGACCRFGQFDHRLYVTALETAYYLASDDPAPSAALRSIPPIAEDACPHADGRRCHARDRRPLGCRIFYCDPAARSWQGPLTEALLTRLRAMHETYTVPYFYTDWIHILRAIREHA